MSTALSLACAEANENDGADATPGDTAGESDEMGASGDEVEGTGETGGETGGDPSPEEDTDSGASSTSDEGGEAPEPSSGCPSFPLIWPTTNSASTETVVHDAFGPRLLGGEYDWHRGVDLPGDPDDGGFYSPVYAAADGRIHAIGNRPNPNKGSISGYAVTAGNLIILSHDLGGEQLYTLYMHLDTIDLAAFPARLGPGEPQLLDLREYFYLDGPDTKNDNRGRPRDTFKTGGAPIETYPWVAQHDPIARIGDTGATFEHLHFETRAGSPNHEYVRNPYAYLPHHDETMHEASLEASADGLRARIEIPRQPGPMGSTTDLEQQLDVEALRLQIRGADEQVLDEIALSLSEINVHDDPNQPSFTVAGVEVEMRPDDFDSGDAVWRLWVDFHGVEAAGFVAHPENGEHLVLEVEDLCGNVSSWSGVP
ncbi:MAG: M23 family metallopeptidase [Myxococcales bacterium]|nr:M23 family metallopeptidase [Myxococcales bacterium]